MDKSYYFSLMRETSKLAYPILSQQIDTIKDVDVDLHRTLRYVVDRRNNELLLKPFLLRLTYELCGGTDWKTTIPAGAAFELLNISSYQANSSFDDKHSVLSFPEKNSQFMASMITRELCLECLGALRGDFDYFLLEDLREALSVCNKHIYIAQHFDLNVLTVNNLSRYTDKDAFLRDYEKRCHHGSGIFTGLCARAGARLAGASKDDLMAIQMFGEYFGTGIQVMNDLADFVPPGIDGLIGRGFQDQFSDLKNGRLTLGCFNLFVNCGEVGQQLMIKVQRGETLSETELHNIATLMAEKGVIDDVKENAKGFVRKAKKELRHFPDSQPKSFLSLMATVCHTNKFIKAFDHLAQHRGMEA